MAGIFETLIQESDKTISIVGGGGKTSLMFLLAQAFQAKGLNVVTTTTTRILKPTSQQTGGLAYYNDGGFQDTLQDCLKRYGHVTVAHHLLPTGNKLQGLTCAQVKQILNQSSVDRMIIEADGARQLSFKAPGSDEPVVLESTDVFISVVGLDIIAKSLEDANVFRAGLVSSRTGLEMGAEITPQTIARLAIHPQGLLKGCPKKARSYIFLNKTDIPDGKNKALSVIKEAKKLDGEHPDYWISASIRKEECGIYSGIFRQVNELNPAFT
jgi:probable selenium-dependent hydroxylase accessory protein YqeC